MSFFRLLSKKVDNIPYSALWCGVGVATTGVAVGLLLHAHVKRWWILDSQFYADGFKLLNRNRAAKQLLGVPIKVGHINSVHFSDDGQTGFFTVKISGTDREGELFMHVTMDEDKKSYRVDTVEMRLTGGLSGRKIIVYKEEK